jgi:hypothetical protein
MTQLAQFIYKFAGPLASMVGPIAGVILAALLGIMMFFRQKEYELVRKRYLEEGVDKIVDQVAQALHIYQQNWSRCFLILKTYRDLKDDTRKELYSSPFAAVDPSTYLSTKHYLLQQLVRDSIFYESCQSLLVFLNEASNLFENDLCGAIKIQIEGGKSHSIGPEHREDIIATYSKRLVTLNKEAEPYWELLRNLQVISFVLERHKFTFDKLEQFHKDKTVLSCIENVKSLFGKKIADLKNMGD